VKRRALAAALLVCSILVSAGCSPEATRTRSGGPGADVGNHSRDLPEQSTAPKPAARP
jgi:hypothetical protein